MNANRRFFVLGLAGTAVLAGCGSGQWYTSYADVIDPAIAEGWRVSEIDVRVPDTLTVSEANTFAPKADIVWRGDPVGNRYEQVDRIITEAATAGSSGLKGRRRVRLVIVVSTFHALTEKTRFVLESSGVHNISFTAQIFDVSTGAPLTVADPIKADLIGYTGKEALASEARGESQRSRIIEHVTEVISGWLGAGPDVRGSFQRTGR